MLLANIKIVDWWHQCNWELQGNEKSETSHPPVPPLDVEIKRFPVPQTCC